MLLSDCIIRGLGSSCVNQEVLSRRPHAPFYHSPVFPFLGLNNLEREKGNLRFIMKTLLDFKCRIEHIFTNNLCITHLYQLQI